MPEIRPRRGSDEHTDEQWRAYLTGRFEPHDPLMVEFPFTYEGVTIEQEDSGFWVTGERLYPYWIGPKALSALRAAGIAR